MDTQSKVIPETLLKRAVDYYGSDKWFYIKHPALGYVSPIAWLKDGKDYREVERILISDTK